MMTISMRERLAGPAESGRIAGASVCFGGRISEVGQTTRDGLSDRGHPHAGNLGSGTAGKLNADHCRIPTIFITAHGDAKMRMQAMRAGAVEFLAKPFDDEALLESVRAALES